MSKFKMWLLLFGTALIVFFIKASIVYLRNRKNAKKFESLAAALGSKTVVSFDHVYVRLFKGDIEVRIGTGLIGKALCLQIAWMSPLDFKRTMAKKNLTSQMRYGSMKEVKLSVNGLDGNYLVRSSDPARAKRFLKDPAIWQALEQLFRSGFEVLKTSRTGKHVFLTGGSYSKMALSPTRIHSHLDQLEVVLSS